MELFCDYLSDNKLMVIISVFSNQFIFLRKYPFEGFLNQKSGWKGLSIMYAVDIYTQGYIAQSLMTDFCLNFHKTRT